MAFPTPTSRPCVLPSPVLLEAVGGCYDPTVSDESPPTDVSTPNLEAGLPWPLTLGGHGPAHNAAGGALEATVWGWEREGQRWTEKKEGEEERLVRNEGRKQRKVKERERDRPQKR